MGNLTGKEVAQMHKDYVMQSWSKSGVDALPVEKAKGIYFWDYDGKKYADMASLLVCSNLGHELPEIVEAIKEQADKMCFMAPAYASEPKSKLAKMLVEAAGADHFKRVFFTNGGAESNENAIKMARMVTGRTKVFSCYRSYHGATLGASNASGDWRRFAAEIGGANGFVKFMNPQMYRDGYTYGVDDEAVTKKALADLDLQLRYEGPQNVAAILMESIVGANGVILPPKGYMEGVRKLCDEKGILLILDEIQCGMGRTGSMFAYQQYGVKPDIVTVAKALGCGVPVGAFAAKDEVAKALVPGDHGTTYGGNPLACAAAVKVFELFDSLKVLDNVKEVGAYLASELDKIVDEYDIATERRGMGLIQGLQLSVNPKDVIANALDNGLILFSAGTNVIRFVPPLVITKADVDEMIVRLKKSLDSCR